MVVEDVAVVSAILVVSSVEGILELEVPFVFVIRGWVVEEVVEAGASVVEETGVTGKVPNTKEK